MAKKAKYSVAQGVQLFLIDKILQSRFPPRFKDFIGSGDDVKFFGEWSSIVREYFSDELSKASLKLPAALKGASFKSTAFLKKMISMKHGAAESASAKDRPEKGPKTDADLTDLQDVPSEFQEFLGKSEYSAYFELLEDKDLGRLMLIEYPEETGLIMQVKEQVEEEVSQDDERVIDDEIRRIIKLPKGAITDELYAGITVLNLPSKDLKNLSGKIIEKLTGLETLQLYDNQLTSVPESLGNLSSLKQLYLFGNRLTSVPESLGNLSSLIRLDLDRNQLTSVPESLGNLSSLARLDLNGNQLTSVPESLGNLNSLTELRLHENQLTSVPDSFGNLRSLRKLYLAGNRFTEAEKTRIQGLLPDCETEF